MQTPSVHSPDPESAQQERELPLQQDGINENDLTIDKSCETAKGEPEHAETHDSHDKSFSHQSKTASDAHSILSNPESNPDSLTRRHSEKKSSNEGASDVGSRIKADSSAEVTSHKDLGVNVNLEETVYSDDDIALEEEDVLLSNLVTSSPIANRPLTVEEQRRGLAQRLAERLVQAALLGGAKDNITVMVSLLPGYDIKI